jgi:hypothetical protein
VIDPAIFTGTRRLDGLGSVAHDDRMVALDEDQMSAQLLDQLRVNTDPARDHRPGDGQSRCAADMTKSVIQGTQAP